MAHKLDLSRLSDEEAKHVWDVIQRDFNLRKAEEERLGEMKTKIEKEDTKRELLGSQSNLGDSNCIRCLQPFKFLVNSKRQCLDCQSHVCKACSRYNKKEHGWVCDNCRMTRVVKISTAGWFHDNMRNRFKHFGSAKVMRSLYKRLNGDGSKDDDTQSMPDVRPSHNGHEDDHEADVQRLKTMRKNKRLLSVHPLDFEPEEYYPAPPRRQSFQYQQLQEERMFRNEMEFQNDMYNHRMHRRMSMGYGPMFPDEYGDSRMGPVRSMSKISSAVSRQQYVDTSDEEDAMRYPPVHQQPYRRRASRASQETLHPPAPPMNELTKRMTVIEGLLNRLEVKITDEDDKAMTPAAQNEEEKLRRKLREMTGNFGDKGLSSDDEPGKRPSLARGTSAKTGASLPLVNDPEMSSSSGDEMRTESQKRSTAAALCDLTTEVLRTINATENAMVEYGLAEPIDRSHLVGADAKRADDAYRELEENVYMAAGKSFELESKLRQLEGSTKSRFGGTTDSDLSELEDVVALTAARVQSTESEVSDIESKIAALSVAGMDKIKKKVSGLQQRKSKA